MKKAIYRLLALAILAAGGWYGYQWYKKLPSHQEQVATAKVQRSDVVIRAFTRGELRAVRAVMLPAPNLNGTVQVTTLAPGGALANEKDLVVEYDDSELDATLDEDKMGLEQVDEQIKGQKANMAITQSQDQLSLVATQYNVRRAELQVQMNPVIDAIDGKKNLLSVAQSNQALTQLQEDIKSRQQQADSQLAVLQETRNRSLLNIQRDQQRLANCKSLAPITGLVSIQQNRAGNFNFGQVMPDIREGDTLTPGMPVAQLLDLSEVEVWAKVGELDRANLVEGQETLLQLDSIPDKQFHGKIKTLTGTASADVFSGDPAKKFDVVFSVDMRQLLTGLGMKPADLDRIMATAEANAKKQISNSASSLFAPLQGAPGATPGMFGQGGGQGQDSGDDQGVVGRGRRGGDAAGRGESSQRGGDDAGRGEGRAGAAGGSGRGAMSDADRQKMRDAMQSASPEERQRLMQQFGGGRGPTDQSGGQGRGAGAAQPGGDSQGAGGRGGRNTIQALMARSGNPFSDQDRANAKLPLPPEKDSQVQVLLRPGLLADVEIMVEKIPDALHLPAQAIFERGGKPTVFVRQKDGKFVAREVQLFKQSESMMVLSGGVQPGDVVALADPTADKNAKKDKGDKKSNGNPMSSMPGGK
jgi:membrane fusion protein (multidrug efflux system)